VITFAIYIYLSMNPTLISLRVFNSQFVENNTAIQ